MAEAMPMRRAYGFLWLSQTLSRFGDGFFLIAVSWLVFADTGSPWALGVLWFLRRGIVAVAGTVLSPLADRVDRRRLMIGLDAGRALLAASPLALHALGILRVWELYAVLLGTGVLTTPYTPAAYAVLARVVTAPLLARANAVLSGGLEVMYMLGPAAGGLFISRFGAPASMAVDGATYAVSAVCVLAMPGAVGAAATAAVRAERYTASLALGWRLVREHATLRVLTLLNAVQGSTDMVFAVLMVPFVRLVLHGGSVAVGLLEASLSAGVVIASLAAARRGWAPGVAVVALSVALFCLSTAGLAWAPSLGWALGLQAAAGLFIGVFQIRSQVLFQTLVADERLGRALGVQAGALAAAQSVSALLAGLAPAVAGVAGAFGLFGIAGTLVTAALIAGGRRSGWLMAAAGPTSSGAAAADRAL